MNMTEGNVYTWSANDYSNLVTICSAAAASTLLVVFRSRCSNISLCWGLWSCARVVKEDSDEEQPPEGAAADDAVAQPQLVP